MGARARVGCRARVGAAPEWGAAPKYGAAPEWVPRPSGCRARPGCPPAGGSCPEFDSLRVIIHYKKLLGNRFSVIFTLTLVKNTHFSLRHFIARLDFIPISPPPEPHIPPPEPPSMAKDRLCLEAQPVFCHFQMYRGRPVKPAAADSRIYRGLPVLFPLRVRSAGPLPPPGVD